MRERKGRWTSNKIEQLGLSRTLEALLAEITNLDHGTGCTASNLYLAETLRLRMDTVSKYISKLKKLGYIKQIYFDGRTRKLSSIFAQGIEDSKKSYAASDKTPVQPRKIAQSGIGYPSKPEVAKNESAFVPKEKNKINSKVHTHELEILAKHCLDFSIYSNREIDPNEKWKDLLIRKGLDPNMYQMAKFLKNQFA